MKLATETGTVHYELKVARTSYDFKNGEAVSTTINKVSGNYPDEYEISSTSVRLNRVRVYNQTETILHFGDWFSTNHIRQQYNSDEVSTTLDYVNDDIASLISDTVYTTIEYAGSPQSSVINFKSAYIDIWITWEVPSGDDNTGGGDSGGGSEGGDSGGGGDDPGDSGDEEDNEEDYENPNYGGEGGIYNVAISPANNSRILFSALSSGKLFSIKSDIPSSSYVDLHLYVDTWENEPLYYKTSSNGTYVPFPEDGLHIVNDPTSGQTGKLPSSLYIKSATQITKKQYMSIEITGTVDDDDCFQYIFDYFLTKSSTDPIGVYYEWCFFCGDKHTLRPSELTSYSGAWIRFCGLVDDAYVEQELPYASSVNLTLKASLASGLPVYYYDDHGHYVDLETIDGVEDLTLIPETGLKYTNLSNLKGVMEDGFYLLTASTPPEGDILTLSMSGTINGVTMDRGVAVYTIVDATQCYPPTGISINDSDLAQSVTDGTVMLKWWGALPGTNNPIAGYRILYQDRIGTSNKPIITYKNIKSIQSSGQLEVPTPNPGEARCYYVMTLGENATEELHSEQKASKYITRNLITPCLAPTTVYVGSTISNDISNLYFSGASHGDFNKSKYYEIQRSLRLENGTTWSEWEDCNKAFLEELTPSYSFSGDHYVENNINGVPYVYLTSDGVFTVDKDILVDVFLVGAGGGGALGCRQRTNTSGSVTYYELPASGGGGGYTTNVFKLLLKQGQEYNVFIGQGGKGGYLTEDGITESLQGENGGNTTAFGYEAHGGYGGNCRSVYTHTDGFKGYIGGNGGSAGGSGATSNDPGRGAFDGADSLGVATYPESQLYNFTGAFGQGFTTRSFMEPNDKAYASGGGGVSINTSGSISVGVGGDSTAGQGVKGGLTTLPDALPNSGSGGGARCGRYYYDGIYSLAKTLGGSGGSGIVIVRPAFCYTQVTPPKTEKNTYKYRVRLVGEAGPDFASEWTESSNDLTRDLFPFSEYTDNPAEPYTTVVKAVHTIELQDRISKMAAFYTNNQSTLSNPVAHQTPISQWTTHMTQCQNTFDKMNGVHDAWIPLNGVSIPQAEIINQIREIVDQGHIVKTTFRDNDDAPYETINKAGREIAYKDSIPRVEPKQSVEYIFRGWQYMGGQQKDDALAGVTYNRIIQPRFVSIPRRYTVEFYSGDTLIYQTEVPAGKTPIYQGFTPVRTDIDDPENFEFDKWNHDISPIYDNTKYYAIFSHSQLTETIKDTWEEILQSIEDGSYATKYKAGDTKELNLGELGYVNMTVAAVDFDELSDGSGTAAITWLSEQLLPNGVAWHADRTATWENCDLRKYLHDTVMPHIPENIRNNIAAIHDTNDLVWVPSYGEVYGASAFYYVLFQNNNSKRIKKTLSGVTADWWLRDVYNSTSARYIDTSGSASTSTPTVIKCMPLCFCTGKTPKLEE